MIDANFGEIKLAATGEKSISLNDLTGQWIVLYFYPKDNTPGCSTEGENFRDLHHEFESLGAVVLGVSRDSIKSHENFKSKMTFPFDLLSDSEELLCNAFTVIKMKNMYGKQVRGIERSTFIISPSGEVEKEWRGVKVPGHVNEVLELLKNLSVS
ncbi:peroxiredoxin [Leeia sp. TBRC 13508]|uniref:thioredoxin-dependent peroxiredoxin n=1 Tax=Leeia speluncae TaxID=2884804 RepID=A0ABS8D350_9NEIS|nr:peroxiredoxin [Leeia speluncae]MCB6182428.1 peroxiredoxin [Leeia speluncae]